MKKRALLFGFSAVIALLFVSGEMFMRFGYAEPEEGQESMPEDIQEDTAEEADEETGLLEAPEYYEQGEAFLRDGDFDRAIESFEMSVLIDPRNAEAHYRLGILYWHARDNERKAVYHIKKFLRLSVDPDRKAEGRYLLRMFTNDADRTH